MIEFEKIFSSYGEILMSQEMSTKIRTAVDEAIKNGSRRLRVVYREDSSEGLLDLERLNAAGQIRLSNMALMVAMSVRMTNDWEHDSNRIFIIDLTEAFDANWFIDKMSGNLESVAYCKPKVH